MGEIEVAQGVQCGGGEAGVAFGAQGAGEAGAVKLQEFGGHAAEEFAFVEAAVEMAAVKVVEVFAGPCFWERLGVDGAEAFLGQESFVRHGVLAREDGVLG